MTVNYEADLHNHTLCSDGEHTPEELIREAADIGLKAVAITDHDTIEGLEDGLAAARNAGIECVCGTEITVRYIEPFFTGSIHLLVYFQENLLAESSFLEETRTVLEKGRGPSLVASRVQAINQVFGPKGRKSALPRALTEADLYRHGHRISRRHFALALNDMGITDKADVAAIIGNDSPAYIPSGVPLETLVPYLEKWPLIRVLAHPAAGSFPGDSHYKEVCPPLEIVERIIPDFITAGLHGLEASYPAHTEALQRRVEQIAESLGLPLCTGGSDTHDRAERPLGVTGTGMDTVHRMRNIWKDME